ncbi:MAG: hypothetical protein O9972_61635, partial [Burkholderiales bacterium]|nr:hypothetical protein [Burkholderiales bacterium]
MLRPTPAAFVAMLSRSRNHRPAALSNSRITRCSTNSLRFTASRRKEVFRASRVEVSIDFISPTAASARSPSADRSVISSRSCTRNATEVGTLTCVALTMEAGSGTAPAPLRADETRIASESAPSPSTTAIGVRYSAGGERGERRRPRAGTRQQSCTPPRQTRSRQPRSVTPCSRPLPAIRRSRILRHAVIVPACCASAPQAVEHRWASLCENTWMTTTDAIAPPESACASRGGVQVMTIRTVFGSPPIAPKTTVALAAGSPLPGARRRVVSQLRNCTPP